MLIKKQLCGNGSEVKCKGRSEGAENCLKSFSERQSPGMYVGSAQDCVM
jgi:hypothetical protein